MSGLPGLALGVVNPVAGAAVSAWSAVPASVKKWGCIALAVIAILLIGKCAYDRHERQMLSDHDNAIAAQQVQATLNATNNADAADQSISAADANHQAVLQGAITNATQAHPQDAGRPSGPATTAALRCLRDHSC